jgi:phosphatidylserine decarboxylase
VVQIAGLIARRIRCDVTIDEEVKNGQVYGLIRFGSRVDIYLPSGAVPAVIKGQRVTSGESIICDLGKGGSLPEGELR